MKVFQCVNIVMVAITIYLLAKQIHDQWETRIIDDENLVIQRKRSKQGR